jgi:hypothetical protein
MEPSTVLLAQALTLSGLIGSAGAYAGIVRRRAEWRLEMRAADASTRSAVDRVQRVIALGRIDRTFVRSAYLPHGRYPEAERRRWRSRNLPR